MQPLLILKVKNGHENLNYNNKFTIVFVFNVKVTNQLTKMCSKNVLLLLTITYYETVISEFSHILPNVQFFFKHFRTLELFRANVKNIKEPMILSFFKHYGIVT